MFSFFNTKYRGPFYPGDWVKRSFCEVSENLKFQMNRIFKQRIKNSAIFLTNRCNYCCLVFAIKVNLTPVTWRFNLGGRCNTIVLRTCCNCTCYSTCFVMLYMTSNICDITYGPLYTQLCYVSAVTVHVAVHVLLCCTWQATYVTGNKRTPTLSYIKLS